jgi:hypothetical protein
MKIRPIHTTEYPVLEDFLYNAIYIPEGEEYPSYEIIFEPEIYIYVKDFGGKDDCGVVSVQKDNPAVRFYERLGYEITEERLDHANHEDYLMLRKL